MDEDGLIAWELVQTAHLVGLRFTELLAALDLTPTQYAVLMHLDADSGLSQADLARLVLVRQQSMGVLLGTMVQRGLVARDGPGGRGRRAGLSLTDAGREALSIARPAVVAFNEPAAMGLTAADAERLIAGLGAIRQRLASSG